MPVLLQSFVVDAFTRTSAKRLLRGSPLPDCLKAAARLLALFLPLLIPALLFLMELLALPITTPKYVFVTRSIGPVSGYICS
jgi:hypothetical protein